MAFYRSTVGSSYRTQGRLVPFWSTANMLFNKNNLIAYYRLDENAGNTVDLYNGRTLTNSSVTFTGGKIGNCANFNAGASTYLESSDSGFNLSGDFTFAYWLNFNSTATSGCLVAKYNYNGVNQRAYQTWFNANALWMANCTDGSSGTEASGSVSWSPATGTWYHVAYVFSISTGVCTIYVNGSSIGTITGLRTSVTVFTANFRLGNNYSSVALNAKMDEVAIFSRQLASNEIAFLYNAGNGVQLI